MTNQKDPISVSFSIISVPPDGFRGPGDGKDQPFYINASSPGRENRCLRKRKEILLAFHPLK
jgi:hypothetical protein